MSLNHSAIFEKIQELVPTTRTVGDCMRDIIAICSSGIRHADWTKLAAIDYDGDVEALSPWIGELFASQPAPFPIQGLWFGLCNPSKGSAVWADLYVGSKSEFDPDDEEFEWLWSGKEHYPKNAEAHSTSLLSIYEIAYGSESGLGNDAEWPLCLAFGALAVRTLLSGQTTGLVASTASRVGVAAGFDSGDLLLVGELRDSGFVTYAKK